MLWQRWFRLESDRCRARGAALDVPCLISRRDRSPICKRSPMNSPKTRLLCVRPSTRTRLGRAGGGDRTFGYE